MAIKVDVKDNKIELALRKFKRKVKDSGLLLELREREFYTKPSDTKRVKKSKAKLRIKYDKLRRERERKLKGFWTFCIYSLYLFKIKYTITIPW